MTDDITRGVIKTITFFYQVGQINIISCCGICGNVWQESQFDPGISQVGGGGFGLFQWTYPARKRGLFNYLNQHGFVKDSFQGQLEYALIELRSPEYKQLYKDLKTFQTIAEATTAFCNKFERPGKPHLEKRIKYAVQSHDIWKAYIDKEYNEGFEETLDEPDFSLDK
jgi:hypothetical protein